MGLPTPATTMDEFMAATDALETTRYREDFVCFGIGTALVPSNQKPTPGNVLDATFLSFSLAGDNVRTFRVLRQLAPVKLRRDGVVFLTTSDINALNRQFAFLEGDGKVHGNREALLALNDVDRDDAPEGYRRLPIIAASMEGPKPAGNAAVETLWDLADHKARYQHIGDLPQRVEALYAALGKGETHVGSGDFWEVVNDGDSMFNQGLIRATEVLNGVRHPQAWVKDMVKLYFKLGNQLGGSVHNPSYDMVPLRHDGWETHQFEQAGFRMMEGCVWRAMTYIGRGTVGMGGSKGNVGAYVGDGVMLDRDSGAGACSVIMDRVHLGGDHATGGVLSPAEANGVVYERDAFAGPQGEGFSGVWVRRNAVLTAGTVVGGKSRIYDRTTMSWLPDLGIVPPGAVVAMGIVGEEFIENGVALLRPIVVKYRDPGTDAALIEEEVLRDFALPKAA